MEAGLIDAQTLAQCKYAGQVDSEELAQLLADLGDELPMGDLLQLCRLQGRGGINRGPGTAPISNTKTTLA